MIQSEDNYVEILFRFYSDLLEEETDETLWAEVVNEETGLYKIASIPFYAPALASGDVIAAAFDEKEDMLVYTETVDRSGNSTVQVILLHESRDINAVRKIFDEMGCTSERVDERYFAMTIPADVEYRPVRRRLEELEEGEVLSYAELYVSARHADAVK